MEGVQATFSRIEGPTGSRLKDGRVELLIFTSEGRALAGTVSISSPKEASSLSVSGFSRRLVADQPSAFDLSSKLGAYSSVEVRIQDPQNVSLDAKAADVRVAQDDRRITFSAPASALPGVKSGQLLNVVLRLKRTPDSFPLEFPVAHNVVYFADAKDTKVSVGMVGTPKSLPLSLSLIFSPALLEGFGAMSTKRPRLTATALMDGDTLPLHDMVCEIKGTSCKVRVSASAQIAQQIANGKGPWKLGLAFADDDAPTLEKSEIEISR
jgi:hypothetical protein